MILTLGTAGCGQASFGLVADDESSALTQPTYQRLPRSGTNPPGTGNPITCFPTESSNGSITAKNGLQGTIRYLHDDQPRYSTVQDHLNYGTVADVDLFLANVNTPNRRWNNGFETSENEYLRRQDGKILTEYFSLDLTSFIKLSNADDSGQYQFAIISDDGAIFEIQNSSGRLLGTIDSKVGPEKMGCSENISLEKGRYYPMRIGYFQGPREHISLTLLWRKVNSTASDELCGKGGMEFFHDSSTTPSAPSANYRALTSPARGWKVVEAKNFILESGRNPCVQ